MKKILVSVISLMMLAGCASRYEYYRGNILYYQDGDDCIFTSTESGRHFDDGDQNLDKDKKVVHRNTSCADLYKRDMSIRAAGGMGTTLISSEKAEKMLLPVMPNVVTMPNYGRDGALVRRKYAVIS